MNGNGSIGSFGISSLHVLTAELLGEEQPDGLACVRTGVCTSFQLRHETGRPPKGMSSTENTSCGHSSLRAYMGGLVGTEPAQLAKSNDYIDPLAGFLDRDEVLQLLKCGHVNEMHLPATITAEQMVEELDSDGNGKISWAEFHDYFIHADMGHSSRRTMRNPHRPQAAKRHHADTGGHCVVS
eukprot:TRINITY_DN12540_c0_g1_i1.p1 TRINITY_DN12540_c0_g1~~TRINITY_DN12540_c0_g1_i1.p1  ORF type:complete len:183 (-),score=19.71 TRINITY_DN12540_c0_g1_i1:70-618(-)